MGAAGVVIMPDDLARGVDALCLRALGGLRIVDVGKDAPAEKEAMVGAPRVRPDDLARVVNAECLGIDERGRGIIDRRERAAAQEEAVDVQSVPKLPDDLAQVVDVERKGAVDGCRGVIYRGEDIDRHVVVLLPEVRLWSRRRGIPGVGCSETRPSDRSPRLRPRQCCCPMHPSCSFARE